MPAIDLARFIRTIPDFPSPGISFKDITPLLAEPGMLHEAVTALAAPFEEAAITKVIGIESRGFILGAMLAHHLGAGFVPVRKQGKLPHETIRESYALEYGTDVVEMHVDAVAPHDRVLIHDDVIATGGTAAATCRLVRQAGGEVQGFAFLIGLEALSGERVLPGDLPVHTVLRF